MQNILEKMTELYLVTGNSVKFHEAKNFFEKYVPHITLRQCDLNLLEIQTPRSKSYRAGWNS